MSKSIDVQVHIATSHDDNESAYSHHPVGCLS